MTLRCPHVVTIHRDLLSPARRRAVAAQSVDPAMLAEAAGRQLADLSRRLHRPAAQQARRRSRRTTSISSRWPGRFRRARRSSIKATPILVNGVIYITTPDNIWAIDARTARQLWRYTYPANDAFHIGHRGVAVYKDLGVPHHARRASHRRSTRATAR